MKLLVDLFSERASLYMQRDGAEKKLKKFHQDVKRCQNSNFPSAVEMLNAHFKAAELDKANLSQQIASVDSRLLDIISSLKSKLDGQAHTNAFHNSGRQGLTPPPSEPSSDIALSIDEKLAQMRDGFEVTLRNQVAAECQKLESRLRGDYESQLANLRQELLEERSLRQDLLEERSRRTAVQDGLHDMSLRMDSIEAKVEEHAQLRPQLDQAVKKDAFTDLEARLANLEAEALSYSATVKDADKSAPTQPTCDDKTSMDVDVDQVEKLASLATQSSISLEELEGKVKNILKQMLLGSEEELVPDDRILRLVQPAVEGVQANLQTFLNRFAAGFGTMLDKERAARAELADQFAQFTQSATLVTRELQAIKAELAMFKSAYEAHSHAANAAIGNQAAQIEYVTSLLTSTKGGLDLAKDELRKSMAGLSLRIEHALAWQANFSTRHLFDAITRHLNDTFMREHINAIGNLTMRIESLENYTDANKRRRVP